MRAFSFTIFTGMARVLLRPHHKSRLVLRSVNTSIVRGKKYLLKISSSNIWRDHMDQRIRKYLWLYILCISSFKNSSQSSQQHTTYTPTPDRNSSEKYSSLWSWSLLLRLWTLQYAAQSGFALEMWWMDLFSRYAANPPGQAPPPSQQPDGCHC